MGMKSKTFLPYDLDQQLLLPPDMKDWLPADHLVHMILDVVAVLDISMVLDSYSNSKGGRPPYNPRMMIALLLYGYATGIRSSRKLERATFDQVPFRVLTADQQPDHDTIATFRTKHLAFLEDLFTQSIMLCAEAGLVQLGHVAIDGSKVKANASRHKAMSYGRMSGKEISLRAEIAGMLAEAKTIDQLEDKKFGKGNRGDQLPKALQSRKGRLKKIKEAKTALEQEAKENADIQRRKREESDRRLRAEGKTPRKKKDITDAPAPTAQRNFTDPDSRIMKSGSTKAFEYSYNSQIAVDETAQVIVAADVSQAANDVRELQPLVDQICKNMKAGAKPRKLSADTGYFSEENLKYLEDSGIDAYISTKRPKHGSASKEAARGRIPKGITPKERMARKLRAKAGRKVYSRRKVIVEPVFGQIKQSLGFRDFLMRGHKKVRGEWYLITAVHNLLKLIRAKARLEECGTFG